MCCLDKNVHENQIPSRHKNLVLFLRESLKNHCAPCVVGYQLYCSMVSKVISVFLQWAYWSSAVNQINVCVISKRLAFTSVILLEPSPDTALLWSLPTRQTRHGEVKVVVLRRWGWHYILADYKGVSVSPFSLLTYYASFGTCRTSCWTGSGCQPSRKAFCHLSWIGPKERPRDCETAKNCVSSASLTWAGCLGHTKKRVAGCSPSSFSAAAFCAVLFFSFLLNRCRLLT